SLAAAFLQSPQRSIHLTPPWDFGYERGTAEFFQHRTTPAFDPISAALASADSTLGALLDSRRAARMEEFHAENAQYPGFTELVDRLMELETRPSGPITRATARLAATRLMEL